MGQGKQQQEPAPGASSKAWVGGKCTNAEPGTFNHECGRPAVWTGTKANGYRSGFCDACKANGYEARAFTTWSRIEPIIPVFPLGAVTLSENASNVLAHAGILPADLLNRHATGDSGDVPADTADCNRAAAYGGGGPILSLYDLPRGSVLVITAEDRSATRIDLMPGLPTFPT